MESKLKEMFPSGQWSLGNRSWMVKDGTYFCAAADIIDGEIALTELGRKLASTVKVAAPVVPEVVVDMSLNDELDAILNELEPEAEPEAVPVKRSKKHFG